MRKCFEPQESEGKKKKKKIADPNKARFKAQQEHMLRVFRAQQEHMLHGFRAKQTSYLEPKIGISARLIRNTAKYVKL